MLYVASRQSKKNDSIHGRCSSAKLPAACRSAYTPIANTAPSTGSGNTFDYAQGAVVTLSLTQGLYRNKIPVFKTSLFRLLFRFVAFFATPSAGSNYFYIMWDYILVFAVFKQKSIWYSS
ncbi:MAG: hypothetical protein II957_01955, partial [Treponema sp.]|nr:hypothetical protein [Treponema sp.]